MNLKDTGAHSEAHSSSASQTLAREAGDGMLAGEAAFASEYPFAPNYLSVGNDPLVRMHYVDEGDSSADPVLFVHGNPTWSFYFRKLVSHFSQSQRAIAVDHVGCGKSDKPQDYPYVLAQHVANLRNLIETLDLQRVTLVVHDWGGAIGFGAFLENIDRLSRLVVLNTAAFRSQAIPARISACRIPYVGEFAVRGLNGFARAAIVMATEKPDRMTPAVKAGLLAPYDSWAHRIAIARFVQDIPLDPKHPSYDELLRIERGLTRFQSRPMLLAWGMKDWCFTPAFLDEWIERFPSAEVERYDDAGHYVVEDAHERLIPRIDKFFTEHA